MIQSPQSSIDENPGSDSPNEPGFLVVGRLLKPHGLKGELVMKIFTDFPERLVQGVIVFVGEQHTPHTIRGARSHKDSLLLQFEGIYDRTAAEHLKKQWVRVRKDDRPELPPGEYYHHELIGLTVVSEEGQTLGVVREIITTGANDVLIVKHAEEKEHLIPTTIEVLVNVDHQVGKIIIKIIPGLLSE